MPQVIISCTQVKMFMFLGDFLLDNNLTIKKNLSSRHFFAFIGQNYHYTDKKVRIKTGCVLRSVSPVLPLCLWAPSRFSYLLSPETQGHCILKVTAPASPRPYLRTWVLPRLTFLPGRMDSWVGGISCSRKDGWGDKESASLPHQ